MNGGGKSGLWKSTTSDADFDGTTGYQVSLALAPSNPSFPIVVSSVTYGDRALSYDMAMTFIIQPGIRSLVCTINSPVDQEILLSEKGAVGESHELLRIAWSAANPVAVVSIRGIG